MLPYFYHRELKIEPIGGSEDPKLLTFRTPELGYSSLISRRNAQLSVRGVKSTPCVSSRIGLGTVFSIQKADVERFMRAPSSKAIAESNELRVDKERLLGVLRRHKAAGLSESMAAHRDRLRKRKLSEKEVRSRGRD